MQKSGPRRERCARGLNHQCRLREDRVKLYRIWATRFLSGQLRAFRSENPGRKGPFEEVVTVGPVGRPATQAFGEF